MIVEKSQSYSVIDYCNTFVSQKIESVYFNHAPKQNSPPYFYHYPPGRRELPIHSEQRFLKIFFLEELPKWTKVSVTSFDKFHHLCNLYIFWFMFCYAII